MMARGNRTSKQGVAGSSPAGRAYKINTLLYKSRFFQRPGVDTSVAFISTNLNSFPQVSKPKSTGSNIRARFFERNRGCGPHRQSGIEAEARHDCSAGGAETIDHRSLISTYAVG